MNHKIIIEITKNPDSSGTYDLYIEVDGKEHAWLEEYGTLGAVIDDAKNEIINIRSTK